MRTAGVIGWPIAHSKSPVIHRFWLDALAIDGDYARFAVAPEDLAAAVQALPMLGFAGVNVTVPHKVAVLPLLDRIEPLAKELGACNTILVRNGALLGTNTDLAGFMEPLRALARPARAQHGGAQHGGAGEEAREFHGKSAVVIGAGGAARAVLVGLRELGFADVTLMNRTPVKAAGLLRRLKVAGEARPLDAPLPAADLVVNASPLGMTGQPPLLLDLAPLPPAAIVYDIVYQPLETALLRAARARGLRTLDGLQMLVGQAALAFERFFGVPPPRSSDGALRRLLVADS